MISFNYSEAEINCLRNFSTINASMIMEPEGFKVINTSKSVIAYYSFEKPYDFESYGIYETSDFLAAIGAMSTPQIEVNPKYLTITDGTSKLKYFTTAKTLLPEVPDVATKFNKLTYDLDFTITADKLAALLKMATILKSKYIFLESVDKNIRITAGDELDSSNNNYEILIDVGVKASTLKTPAKLLLTDFKIMPGEFKVLLTPAICKWENMSGIEYYIRCQS